MNPQYRLTALSFAGTFLLLLFSGCDKNNVKYYVEYQPIYAQHTDVINSINGDANEGIHSAGKIYVNDPYIFVSDTGRGIHIIDNHDPSHPVQAAFLAIPGNNDIVVKGNTLYADMYDELLTLDISDVHHVKVTNQIQNAFYSDVNASSQVIVGYKKVYHRIEPNLPRLPISPTTGCPYCSVPSMYSSSSASSTSTGTGTGGSMAKMTLVGNYLYTIPERHSLQVIDITKDAAPQLGQKIMAGFDLETIFPFEDKLFIGSMEGVYIFSLTDPAVPANIGKFTHGRACDPVIADGNYAYVTLHEGTQCGGAANELDVIDIKDLNNPVMASTVSMTKPMGLSKDGDWLFVCDGPGVKVFDASAPASLQQKSTLDVGNAYDVITTNKRLVVMSDKGLYQFDYSLAGMPLLSTLPMSSIGNK